ncbi:hypothetical protein N0V86_008867 [Didymella sp. IMI 355093]|nr:hypothetical protein N0V86_008867 [Didymella sp. IMI 355093]
MIRILRLRWTIRALPYLRRIGSNKLAYCEDTENWEKGWDILAKMKGLKSLKVVLVDTSAQGIWEDSWLELEAAIMEPVKKVKLEGRFEVTLPYASCDVERDMGASAVRLFRPGDVFDKHSWSKVSERMTEEKKAMESAG